MQPKKYLTHISQLLVFLLIFAQFSGLVVPKAVSADTVLTQQVSAQIQKTASFIEDSLDTQSDWDILALYLSQKPGSLQYLDHVIKISKDPFSNTTELARTIVGWTASGQDATKVDGVNLISKLGGISLEEMEKQGVNALIWTLLAIDTKPYTLPQDAKFTKDQLITRILEKSLPTGGWSLGPSLDVDITAMALSALSPYSNDSFPKIKEKITLAKEALKQARSTNSNSLSQIIIGLSAMGEDPSSATMQSYVQDLLKYALTDGSFSLYEGQGTDRMATLQALYALVAFEKLNTQGNGLIYQNMTGFLDPIDRDSNNTPPSDNEDHHVLVRVEGPTSTLAEGSVQGSTASEAIKNLLGDDLTVTGATYNSEYITSIHGIDDSHGGYWMFAVLRDGQWINPDVGIGVFELEAKDEVLVYYGNYADLVHSITVYPAQPKIGEPVTVHVQKGTWDWDNLQWSLSAADGVKVKIGSLSMITDQDGNVNFANGLSAGSHTIEVTSYREGGPPPVIKAKKTLEVIAPSVKVRVEGPQSLLTEGNAKGYTASEAIKNLLGEDVKVAGIAPNEYITSIRGIDYLSDGDFWMFAVLRDGKWISPDVGIGLFELKEHDEIVVYYGGSAAMVHSITVDPSQPKPGQPFTIQVQKGVWDYMTQQWTISHAAGVSVKIDDQTIITDEEGKALFPKGLSAGNKSIVVTGYQNGLAPTIVRAVSSLTIQSNSGPGTGQVQDNKINFSVKGLNGSTLYGSQEITLQPNDTPYTVLVRALGQSEVGFTGSGTGVYVSSINGLAQFDHGPGSGWMYAVNCENLSSGANSFRLKPGSEVVWWYTLDFGNDWNQCQNQKPSTSPGKLPSLVNDAIDKIDLSPNNQKSIQEISGIVVALLQKDQRMTPEQVKKLKESLQRNSVQLSESVQPGESKEIADAQNEVQLIVPEQAVTTRTDITIQKQSTNRPEVVSSIYTFGPKGIKFNQPVAISIKVPLEMEDLTQLALVWLNEETGEWIPIPAVVDASTGIVTGKVDHFTQFAVIDRNRLTSSKLDISVNLKSAIQHILSQDEISDWEAFALERAGVTIPASYLIEAEKALKENQGNFRKVTDLERMVLGVTAAGQDPTSFAGYNLLEKIYNHNRLTMQGNNGIIFALIALDSKGYEPPVQAKWNRTSLVNYLLEHQNPDGGWPLAVGNDSSVDLTAMALAALSPYQDQNDVADAIKNALNWLSVRQIDNGGYQEYGVENSESISQVIQGLAAIGIDPLDARFVKSDGNLLTALLSYQHKNGGFIHIQGQEPNEMATEQALAALVAYNYFSQKKGSIYQFNAEGEPAVSRYADEAQIAAWARDAVYRALQEKVMAGTSTGIPKFSPKEPLTRAQFATLLHKVLGENPAATGQQIFTDVKPHSWYDGYVANAYAKDWVKGISANAFGPDKPITRQDMAVILNNALKLESSSAAVTEIRDINKAKAYAKSSIAAIYDHQLMRGYNGYFNPDDLVTREMAAVVAMEIFDRLNR